MKYLFLLRKAFYEDRETSLVELSGRGDIAET